MANLNGAKYGYTGIFPIARQQTTDLRALLRSLDDTERYPPGSPLGEVPIVHMARLFIVDRLAYQGTPAKFDKLRSDYLVFVCDFDGDSVDTLVDAMASGIPETVAAIWGHCIGFPGLRPRDPLSAYFERCQIKTTLFLADQPDASVQDILVALTYRRRLGEFVKRIQREPLDPVALQNEFMRMLRGLRDVRPSPGEL
jgi:hypothetical protein